MKIISVFNNKGGVGKSTLTYHLGHSLASQGYRVLLLDLDPQCNLTICAMEEEELHEIWAEEDPFVDDFEEAFKKNKEAAEKIRTIHFLLRPVEEGISDLTLLSPPKAIDKNIDLIPGRLSLHKYENRIAERWSGLYQSDNLAIRTVTNIRSICTNYSEQNHYDYVLIDTSPSLGILNKVIISTVDGFFIPAQPDMFSLYGIRNIGNSLDLWKNEFDSIYSLISKSKRSKFPSAFVRFLGYTLYNAKKYESGGAKNQFGLAQAHLQYVNQIPETILKYIKKGNRIEIGDLLISEPIGKGAIVRTHNTFPATAQALKCPMWKIPDAWAALTSEKVKEFKENGFSYNRGYNNMLRNDIAEQYRIFSTDLLKRVESL